MKKHWVGLCCMSLILLITNPVLTRAQQTAIKPTLGTVDRKITDLGKRFSLLESNIQRFQLGGSLIIEPAISPDYNFGMVEINQQMELSLDVAIDPNSQFSLRMAQPGRWGLNYQSAGSNAMPLFSPFLVNEAFLRLEKKHQLDYLGRFRYSLGQYGIIADFFLNPVEGFVIQQQFGKLYVIGLYSRIGPQISEDTGEVIGIEDYSAGRIGWISPNAVIGLNLVPNGLYGEKACSIDWSWNQGATEVRAELGWFWYDLPQNEALQVKGTPGILIGYSKTLGASGLFQLKTGYFPKTFTPSSTSLGHMSGILREWFVPNSQGVEVYLRKNVARSWETENRFIILSPVDDPQGGFNYRIRSSLIKTFSPVNQTQFGVEGATIAGRIYPRAFLSWVLRF